MPVPIPVARPTPPTLIKGFGASVAMGFVANTIVWLVGRVGKPIAVIETDGKPPVDLALIRVLAATLFAMILGTIALFVIEKIRANSFSLWGVLVMVIAVVTIFGPLSLKIDSGSKVALSAMHLLTGASAIVGHWFVGRQKTRSGS
jgi:uncharacterized membrane protein YqjE